MTLRRLAHPHGGRMLIYLLFVAAVALSTVAWARHTDQLLCNRLELVSDNQAYVLRHHLVGATEAERREIFRRLQLIQASAC